MNRAKVIKSSRIFLHLSFILGFILSLSNCNNAIVQEDMQSLKRKGFVDLNLDYSVTSSEDSLVLILNGKKRVDNFECDEINSSPTISFISTTHIPNNDGKLHQSTWQTPVEINESFNYYFINLLSKKDSFFVPAINDFESISNGYPVMFIYADEEDFFSDSSGIFVPGINADTNDIKKGGNYAMRGKEWERKVYIQLFSPDARVVDQGWVGSRVHGNLSRAAPQKSIRFYARPAYNKDHFNSLFNDSIPLSRFLIRTPFSSNWQLIYKDVLASEVAIEMGMDAMRFQPVIVYLNGEYWGYYNVRDRVDEYFFFNKYGIDSLDFVDLFSKVKYGSSHDYNKLNNWINKNDLREDENYTILQSFIDIENYRRYLLLELFFANKDWPHNNVRIWKSSELDNKWRWLIFDFDASGRDSVDMYAHINNRVESGRNFWASNLMFGLLANEKFFKQLLNDYNELAEGSLNVEYLQSKADSLSSVYKPLLVDQINRWKFPESMEHFDEMHKNYLQFLVYRDQTIIKELDKLHQLAIDYQNDHYNKE